MSAAVHCLPVRTLRVVLAMIRRPGGLPRPGVPVAVPLPGRDLAHGLVLFLEVPR